MTTKHRPLLDFIFIVSVVGMLLFGTFTFLCVVAALLQESGYMFHKTVYAATVGQTIDPLINVLLANLFYQIAKSFHGTLAQASLRITELSEDVDLDALLEKIEKQREEKVDMPS